MANATIDTGAVLEAIELGWSMAELRARYWMGHGPKPRSTSADDSAENFLPLGRERSPAELAIQTQSVVCGLATTLGLDLDLVRLSYQADATGKASEQLGRLIHQLEVDGPDAWPRFSQFLYAWDARIQDTLAAGSFIESSGYLLGRGLGEICWGPAMASPPGSTDGSADWNNFLGAERRADLLRYLDRLSTCFRPLTGPAIRCSLGAWAEVANDPDWRRQPGIAGQLTVQASLWRDLLLGQRDPESLITASWTLGKARGGWRVLRVFWPQLLTAWIGVLLLTGAAWILADPKSAISHGLGGVLAVLGFFGITSASLHARAKNTAQQLLAKVRLTYDLDLVAEAATLRPAKVALRKPDDRRRAPPITVETSMPEVEIYQAGGRNGNQSDKQDSPAAGRIGEVEGHPATR